MYIAGIDSGQARIGIAISDETHVFAFPLEHVAASGGVDKAAQRVLDALAERELSLIVVGLPLRLDGSEGDAARKARLLGEALRRAGEVRVEYWDERLTTVQASRDLQAIGVDQRKQREVIDASAAALMLQGFLDATRAQR